MMTNCTVDHRIHQFLFPPVYIAVFIIGLPTNLLSLYHSYLQIKQKNELGVYLCNLTISDMLYIISLPFWVQYMLLHDDWVHSRALCILSGLLLYQNIYISIGFLCFISINRCLAVAYPLKFKILHTRRAAVIISVFIWLKEIPACAFYIQSQVLSVDKENDTLCFEQYPMQTEDRYLNSYKLLFGFLLPLILFLFAYKKVLTVVHTVRGLQREQKLRIKKLVSASIIIFLVCFAPYHLFLLVRAIFEHDCKFVNSVFEVYHVGVLLTCLNCVADPILYCFISPSSKGWLGRFLDPITKLLPCRKTEAIDASEIQVKSRLMNKTELAC
ncbi:ovarian cancer G-protein coupled receptor 1-like [Scyliorhinus canicula]|uniref:ovarian cancer G-protein coupled receptor 1-like n=1 Tax=Scyliorhinus canicula TaxID=7830 RepID=UPI0018F63977|nr:ovarian cancer G-protein coupled receptor 1-like [Scyliorhinus canicula]XP_038629255.1 ovarian cancer G-protein coupled receptor 1-like [Scyliorhinus canicula]